MTTKSKYDVIRQQDSFLSTKNDENQNIGYDDQRHRKWYGHFPEDDIKPHTPE